MMADARQGGVQVVTLAAGKGVRMRSARPKVVHRLAGRTLIERVLRATVPLKPSRMVVVVGYGADEVREAVNAASMARAFGDTEVRFAEQTSQLGTGDAARAALPLLEPAGPVLILPGDSPLLTSERLAAFFEEHRATGAQLSFITCEPPDPTGYGRVVRDNRGSVSGIVEHKDCTAAQRHIREINSSIYLVDYGFLTQALSALRNDNAQKEYYLTDIVAAAVADGATVTAHAAGAAVEILGVNSKAELAVLEAIRRAQIAEHWMREGVTMEDPRAVYIDEDVTIGADSFIGAGTRLRGQTVIGERVVIDGNSLISDSTIATGVHVKLGSVITDARVGSRAVIGPYSHLRPGSELSEEVHVGNFVETKQTTIGRGSKANHLSYLGDAAIGPNTNIGAGTITCNYDGTQKHRTAIGRNVFVGSNSSLVAPVAIGDGAFVAAGSTITDEVPAGALGIARGRQVNIENWVQRRKAAAGKQ